MCTKVAVGQCLYACMCFSSSQTHRPVVGGVNLYTLEPVIVLFGFQETQHRSRVDEQPKYN